MKSTNPESVDQLRGSGQDDLLKRDGVELLTFYKKLLLDLGSSGSPRVQAIFANASTSFREARHLAQVVTSIDGLDWYSAKDEGLGDLYEGLLEKNAEETKSGAGQYFTPRPLIESMVEVIKPAPGERIQDPYPLHEDRSRRSSARDAQSSVWTRGQLGEACCSAASGGTVRYPIGRSSSAASSRALVASQYFGASSRYRSRGQYGTTRMISAR